MVRAIAAAMLSTAAALDNGLAQTPPMGFNGYFAGVGGEKGLGEIADFLMSSGLRNSGYVYVNTDEGWEEKERDASGKLQWSKSAYPNGLPTFIDSLHKKGLKFGIYGAASGVTCGNNPGQLYHEQVDAETYASWGVDFLKSDNCASYALDSSVRFAAMRDALRRAGRPMVLSIEPFSMNPDPEQSVEVSNMARIGCDCGDYGCAVQRADLSDKWSPLAQPGYWNDADMIEIDNDLGSKNRAWFGLYAIMKAPLLLSSKLPSLHADVLAVANNTEIIAVNQDPLGVQARKLSIAGKPLPWLVGLEECSAAPVRQYSRNLKAHDTTDTRKWSLQKVSVAAAVPGGDQYLIRNGATDRCLSARGPNVVLLPCDEGDDAQKWAFNKGVTTVTSITNAGTGLALAMSNSSLYAQTYAQDAFPTPDASYGHSGLVLVAPYDQDGCSNRDCENYDHTQMWYFDEFKGLLRQSSYVASINHRDTGEGYRLTPRVPTYRHHCLAHVLSEGNGGTESADLEMWGGPLQGGDFVVALYNRGAAAADVTAEIALLELASDTASYKIRDLWSHEDEGTVRGSFTRTVGSNDLAVYRLSPASDEIVVV